MCSMLCDSEWCDSAAWCGPCEVHVEWCGGELIPLWCGTLLDGVVWCGVRVSRSPVHHCVRVV